MLARYKSAISEGTVYEADYRVRTVEGTFRRVTARAVPLRNMSGTILEWQGVTVPHNGDAATMPNEDPDAERGALTGPQIRGARGLLDWSLAQLAAASGVSVSTIKRMEDGSEGNTRPSKSGAVRSALEAGGIMFRTIDGVTWISR